MDHIDFSWFISEDGKTVESGNLGVIDLNPNENTVLSFNLSSVVPKPGAEYFLTLIARLNQNTSLLNKKHVVAWEQFSLPIHRPTLQADISNFSEIRISEKDTIVDVIGDDFQIILPTYKNQSDIPVHKNITFKHIYPKTYPNKVSLNKMSLNKKLVFLSVLIRTQASLFHFYFSTKYQF